MVVILAGQMAPSPLSLSGKMKSHPSLVTVFLLTQMDAGIAQPASHFCRVPFVTFPLVGTIMLSGEICPVHLLCARLHCTVGTDMSSEKSLCRSLWPHK